MVVVVVMGRGALNAIYHKVDLGNYGHQIRTSKNLVNRLLGRVLLVLVVMTCLKDTKRAKF